MAPDLDRAINRRRPTWSLVVTALVLLGLSIACGSDPQPNPGGTSEFGRSSESVAESSLGSNPGEIGNALASGLWTGFTFVVCALAKWWSPLVAFVAAFLLRLQRSSRYQASRYALPPALRYGTAAGAVALLIALLCWMF